MILRRLIAFPESKHVLVLHLAATPFLAVQFGVFAMVPVLLRRHFEAAAWQITVATSAIAFMSILAIFWNEAYRRLNSRHYLAALWLLSVVPLGAIAFCDRPGTVLVFVLLAAAGMGGINPLVADLLRSCYPPAARNRVFSLMKVVEQLTIMVSALGIGFWLDFDHDAYRVYFPLSVVIIGAGMWLLLRITRQRLFLERQQFTSDQPLLTSLRRAYGNMTRVLRADPDFRRYETAFCIYGLGWMICHALLPFVVVDVLQLRYGQVAWSTQVSFQIALMITLVPAGYLMDRFGSIRTCAWTFAWLLVYPVGLMLAFDAFTLMLVTIAYAVGMAGVNLAWTMGPVTLARDASQAPHYLAIHATLVALRAILGQFPAVALYALTGSVRLPLAIAALTFIVGAFLMFRLERIRQAERLKSADAELEPRVEVA